MGLEESIRRSLADRGTQTPADSRTADPMGPMPQDPSWAAGGTGQPLLARAVDTVQDVAGRVLPH
ncbi:hypothetical protein DV701_02580 [Ornithinimicrobium avium]|uniref:Uncharacterized protein n=1 Tax=Ornithinimicrobium avium TaxID=2283195 RepID=A0A345NJH1_9MICO|nr:hypothetical protein DV701_02580 [Ornithinimicrobium avium]